MNKLTLAEQETIIRYDRSSSEADIFTCDPSLMRKLNNLVKSNPEEVILKRKDITCIEVTIPKKCISVRKPNKRQLTEEQRQSIAERLHTSKSQKAF